MSMEAMTTAKLSFFSFNFVLIVLFPTRDCQNLQLITLELAAQTEYVLVGTDTLEERVANVTATRIIFIIRQPKRANRKCEEKYFHFWKLDYRSRFKASNWTLNLRRAPETFLFITKLIPQLPQMRILRYYKTRLLKIYLFRTIYCQKKSTAAFPGW